MGVRAQGGQGWPANQQKPERQAQAPSQPPRAPPVPTPSPQTGASRAAREERLPCPSPRRGPYSSPGNQHRHPFKVCNSVTVSILKYRAVASTAQLWSMLTSQRKHCFLLPRGLATTNLRPIALDVPVLDILSTWNRTIRGLLCLVSFTLQILSRFPMLQHESDLHYSPELNSIPLCSSTGRHLS